MSVDLFGQGANFALLVFGPSVLVVVGVSLLLYRIVGAAKQSRSTTHVAASGELPDADEVAPAYLVGAHLDESTAKLEMQLADANRALFMVLMDCCNMITEVGEGSPVANAGAFNYATSMRRSGRTAMSNKEIADHSYQLAAELRAFRDPAMTAVRRVLTQLAFSEQWDATLCGGQPFEMSIDPAATQRADETVIAYNSTQIHDEHFLWTDAQQRWGRGPGDQVAREAKLRAGETHAK